MLDLAQSCGWILPHAGVCWASERHTTLRRDDRGRLHCVDGPAVAYPDGWAIYAVHGVLVPERAVMRPESYTSDELRAETNSEVLRVISERLGAPEFLARMGARVVDSWRDPGTGLLYELLDLVERKGAGQPRWLRMRSPLLKDGTEPEYVEKVHPGLASARAARMWQFEIDGKWPTVDGCNGATDELRFAQEA